ncbi:MAG: carbohydrate ABC transporter permease [Chloroflexota bacterium]|jgi:multiple sugar transport system permease protein
MAVSTNAAGAPRRRRRFSILTRQDKLVLGLAVGIPAFIHIFLVWVPTISSIFLSFTSWNGIGGLERIKFVGIDNYVNMFTRYPPFWPALQHNLVWLLTFLFIATPIGIFFAVLLDKNIRGTRLYQSAIYLPVVLSLAIVGFIWQLQYAPEEGVLNNVIHNFFPNAGTISWLGDKNINLAAVLVAASWRHIGYIMVLYLAGLKSVDPSLREAAAIDGASERQTFFRVVLPVLRPINVVILVITVIESLRAFDIVYVINKGQNGLELLSVLITQNIAGESSRVGFGSALAVILLLISVGPIIVFLTRTFEAPE